MNGPCIKRVLILLPSKLNSDPEEMEMTEILYLIIFFPQNQGQRIQGMGQTPAWTNWKVPKISFPLVENRNKISLPQVRKSCVLYGLAQISPSYENSPVTLMLNSIILNEDALTFLPMKFIIQFTRERILPRIR